MKSFIFRVSVSIRIVKIGFRPPAIIAHIPMKYKKTTPFAEGVVFQRSTDSYRLNCATHSSYVTLLSFVLSQIFSHREASLVFLATLFAYFA